MLRLFNLLQVGVTQVEENGRGARAAGERRESGAKATQSLERLDEEESDTAMMGSALAGDAAREGRSRSSAPLGGPGGRVARERPSWRFLLGETARARRSSSVPLGGVSLFGRGAREGRRRSSPLARSTHSLA